MSGKKGVGSDIPINRARLPKVKEPATLNIRGGKDLPAPCINKVRNKAPTPRKCTRVIGKRYSMVDMGVIKSECKVCFPFIGNRRAS